MTRTTEELKDAILEKAVPHVAFDGWSDDTLRKAAEEADVDATTTRAVFPRGAVDLALWFHAAGDRDMADALRRERLQDLKVRERITLAVRKRLEIIEDKEAVRRGTTLFSLPIYAADGARAIWNTADAIWEALNDPSTDINWYTKRATLSAVYGASVLFWLGDTSENHEETWDFLDRRIDDVMLVEKAKAAARENPVLKAAMTGPNWFLSQIKAPPKTPREDLPGLWTPPAS